VWGISSESEGDAEKAGEALATLKPVSQSGFRLSGCQPLPRHVAMRAWKPADVLSDLLTEAAASGP
jgi:hypothetical protein